MVVGGLDPAQGCRVRAVCPVLEALLLKKNTASSLPKVGGGETQPKQPAVELFPSLHFKGEKDAVLSAATRAGGFAAESLDLDFLTSRLNPEEGGKTFATSSSAQGQGLQEPLRL